jgi:class 3 adenylate cyclase/tetratricopeptide (TPR) repeat protein
MKCAHCQSDNPDNMRFCGECGQPLDAAGAAAAPPPPPAGADAERRQVTVLFCDLVGSTRLSDQLDPRDLRAIVRAYQSAVSDVVERYEGHIAQYQGDGVLVYFGFPRALEDAAKRAVLAAREILTAVQKQSDELVRERNIPIAVRIGVHTGEGVTGALGSRNRQEQLLIGSTPTIAGKIQGLARPNEIVVGHTTKHLVEAHFELAPAGESAAGVEAWRVVDQRAREGRLVAVRTLGKHIGRAAEVDRLVSLFEQSRAGRGATVVVSGEAGLGKSRLLHSLEARVPAAFATLGGQCSLYAQNTALYPLVEPFERLFGVQRDKGAASIRPAIFAQLASLGFGDDVRASMASFFGLAPPDGYVAPPATPQKQLEALFDALSSVLVKSSEREPIVLAIEDLHWADPTTVRFLDKLAGDVASARALVLCTTRPDVDVPWIEKRHAERIELKRLSPEVITEIISDRAGGKALPAAIVQQIVQRADGVPLFAEELTREVLESGLVVAEDDHYALARPMEAPSVPAGLRDSLMARLDRFGPAKEVAQVASAIGRFVPWPLLADVAGRGEAELRAQLGRLVEAEILTRDVSGQEEQFIFRHALIQDVAHDSMLRSRRREVHERIARALTDRFPAIAEEQPERVARHFEEAGLGFEATGHLLRGGMKAMGRAAPAEAIAMLTRGVDLLADKDESAERWGRELQLRAILAGALMSSKGYAAPETEEDLVRARELCGLLGDPPEVFMVLYGLWVMHTARGATRESERYAGEIMKFATPDAPPHIEISARFAYAATLLYMARYDDALAEFRRIKALYTPELHGVLVQAFGDDHGCYALSYLMLIELLMGRFDRARAEMADAKKLAETLGDPLARAIVIAHDITLQFVERKPGEVLAASKIVLSVSNEFGYALWRSIAQFGHGWHRAAIGKDAGGVDEMREGLAFWEKLNERVPISLWTGYLADGLIALGRHDDALQAIDQTLADSAGTLDQMFEPELLRMRGDILLVKGDEDGAADHFRRAIARAREQKAGALELRAAVSLGELCEKRGERAEAVSVIQAALSKVTGAEGVPDHERGRAVLSRLTAN